MKSTTGWNRPNTGNINESCFSALPGGICEIFDFGFQGSDYYGYWWSSTASDEYYVWCKILY